jgi:hypothetical protein
MCEDVTEVRVVDPSGEHGYLTWFWPTTQLDSLVGVLGGVTVRDSVGARYSDFVGGDLVFDQSGVRYEIIARTIVSAHPDAVNTPPA